jgi:hypothetical protein
MRGEIPSTIGLLALVGCSDAAAVANTFEKVCKEQCECPTSEWHEVRYCKQACEGYATQLEAYVLDNATGEPCDDLSKILASVKDCAKEDACSGYNECLYSQYQQLYECWPGALAYGYASSSASGSDSEAVSGAELVQQLMMPIPGALAAEQLHSATRD